MSCKIWEDVKRDPLKVEMIAQAVTIKTREYLKQFDDAGLLFNEAHGLTPCEKCGLPYVSSLKCACPKCGHDNEGVQE
jgi:Zn finger protein HypA/HybF involved in hydrogenase expression